MKKYLTLDSVSVTKQLVGIRVDINSAIINSRVEDSLRIVQACESIKELVNKKAKVLVFAHQGRKGKPDFTSLKLHKNLLEKYIGEEIVFIEEISKKSVESVLQKCPKKKVFLIENLRELDCEQHPEFKVNSKSKEKQELEIKQNPITQIIELCSYYILDAFSISHRAHSSVIGSSKVTQVAGRLLQKELKPLSMLQELKHPRVYVMGGLKPDDLVPFIKKSLEEKKVDMILLSGVIGEIALHLNGYDLGVKWKWIVEHKYNIVEKELKALLKKYPKQFVLPIDVAYVDTKHKKRVEIPVSNLDLNSNSKKYKKIVQHNTIQDIGSKTVKKFMQNIAKSKSCYIKGPQGNFEVKGAHVGTYSLYKEVVKSKTFSFMGGGHTVTAAQKSKTVHKFSYVSLAGGALVQYLQGKTLAGIEALQQSYMRYEKKNCSEFDMVVVGSNVQDTFLQVPSLATKELLGSKIKVEDDFNIVMGGGGVNVSSALSKLEAKVGLVTRISSQNAHHLLTCANDCGFTVISSKQHRQGCSKSIIIQSLEDNDRVIYTYRGQNPNFSKEDIPSTLPISNYYFSGLTHKAIVTEHMMIKQLKKQQPHSLICYNPSSYTIELHAQKVVEMLKDVDILVFNDEEAQKLTQERGIKNNLHLLTLMGPKIVIITCADKGAYLIEKGSNEIVFQKSSNISQIVDSTGAGDCFAATFFYFYSKQYDIVSCLEFATLNAGHLITQKGSLNGSLTLKELKKMKYVK